MDLDKFIPEVKNQMIPVCPECFGQSWRYTPDYMQYQCVVCGKKIAEEFMVREDIIPRASIADNTVYEAHRVWLQGQPASRQPPLDIDKVFGKPKRGRKKSAAANWLHNREEG